MIEVFKNRESIFETAKQYTFWSKLNPDGSICPITLDDWYISVSHIVLDENIPDIIKYYFDVAKNVLLYSWFSYEMMPAAELFSYTLVEKALRVKYKCEGKHIPTFAALLKNAIKDRLLTNRGFSVPKNSIIETIKKDKNDEFEEKECYLRTEEELEASQEYIGPICESLPTVRNILAHGNTALHPGGWLTLKVNSEIINMLFRK
jgi:hypothetical protein